MSNPIPNHPFGSSHVDTWKNPIIEELDSDAENEQVEENDKYNVQHPDDQPDDHSNDSKVEIKSVSFKRVTYGGINGAYYTSTSTRKTASDGVVLVESKEADKTSGEATHRISRGIHDKGHSLTRKLNSDGKVDTNQILHNLHEDELASFEQAWKGSADGLMSTYDSGRGGWALPFRGLDGNVQSQSSSSSGGKPKKIVRINIE